MKKIVYVAHEISGDIEGNTKKILEICRKMHSRDVIPFAPYLTALQYLDDNSPEDRGLGVEANMEYLKRGFVDEMGVFGSRVSKGIFDEIDLALQLGIPVEVYDRRAAVDVHYALEGLKKKDVLFRYSVAERRLANKNHLFFRRDNVSDDIVLVESEIVIDPESGKDVSRFVPSVRHYDEILDGWSFLDERCNGLSRIDALDFRERVYDGLTNLYEEGRPLLNFCRNSSFNLLTN